LEVLRDVLKGIETGVSVEEVKRVENEWIEWFSRRRVGGWGSLSS
jgi:hypothetical protein